DGLRETAADAGVRLIGPNCMGLLYPELGISFRTDMSRKPGPIGFLSQSGNLLFELTHFGESRGLRFSKAISYGNALDLNECAFLEYFADDAETRVVGAYIEGVRDGRAFIQTLGRASSRKPTVVLKGGRTDAGGRTAVSHTAALAGSAAVWEAAVRQSGALSVATVEELGDALIGCGYMRAPAGVHSGHRLPRPRLALGGGGAVRRGGRENEQAVRGGSWSLGLCGRGALESRIRGSRASGRGRRGSLPERGTGRQDAGAACRLLESPPGLEGISFRALLAL